MEKLKLLELDIDIDSLVKSTSEVKKEIDLLKEAQKQLKKEGQTGSETFIRNAADLKALSKGYRENLNVISQYTTEVSNAAANEKLMVLALDKEVESIKEARDQNKFLNKLRNETNVSTKEGKERLEALNAKLDQNNAFIKENADAYTQQKINIGNYRDSIRGALEDLNPLNGGLSGFIARAKEAGGVGPLVVRSLNGMAEGFAGLTKAAFAFIATPIGAVLAVLVGAFALVKNAMNRSEDATNKLKRAFAAVTGVFNTVLKALEPVGEFLINGIVLGFELAAKAADDAINIISSGLKALGFDSAAKSVNDWKNEIQEGVKAAQDLADAEASLEKAQRKAQLTQLEYQKDAEKLRQIRDNESLSVKERIAANEELGVVLQNQLKSELAIAELALKAANLRIEADGRTKEALDGQAEALTRIADIQERITGQESEQLTNRVQLQKDATDKAVEFAKAKLDAEIEASELSLEKYIANNEKINSSLDERLKFNEAILEKESGILKQQLDGQLISQEEYEVGLLKLKKEFAGKNAEATIDNLETELDLYIAQNRSKLDSEAQLTDSLVAEEQNRLQAIYDKRLSLLEEQRGKELIGDQEFQIQKLQLQSDFLEQRTELENQFKIQKDEQEQLDFENELELKQLRRENDFQIQLEQLDRIYMAEIAAAEKLGQDVTAIKAIYAEKQTAIETAAFNLRLQGAAQVAQGVAQIAGKESALGKAAAIAQATINTYQGATLSLASFPGPIGIAMAALTVGAGLASVAKILGIKGAEGKAAGLSNVASGIGKVKTGTIPKAEKGMAIDIGGKRHSSGGTQFYGDDGTRFEAEQGEKMFILSRRASESLGPLLSDINQSYGGVSLSRHSAYLASGGQVLRGLRGNASVQRGNGALDILALGNVISEANRSLPRPVTDVKNIIGEMGNYNEVVNGANL